MESSPQIDSGKDFQDGVTINQQKFPKFFTKMADMQKPQNQRSEFTPAHSIQCLSEAIEWLFDCVDSMELENKDIFIVVGASRAGKGTLLAALQGVEMKFFKSNPSIKETAVGKEATTKNFMAPVDSKGLPLTNAIISHQHNSHTFKPKIVGDGHYVDAFKDLENTHLIDFPGMFDSKGYELDIAMHMALQRVINQAKSARMLVLVQATCLISENNHIIQTIKGKLNNMFRDAEKHMVIAITKNQMVSQQFDEDEIIDIATGEDGQNISFKGYEVIQVEQDNIE